MYMRLVDRGPDRHRPRERGGRNLLRIYVYIYYPHIYIPFG